MTDNKVVENAYLRERRPNCTYLHVYKKSKLMVGSRFKFVVSTLIKKTDANLIL